MLIIRCREGETISVADNVQISILSLGEGRVKLGVVAPPEIKVVRKEFEATRLANSEAANIHAGALQAALTSLSALHLRSAVTILPGEENPIKKIEKAPGLAEEVLDGKTVAQAGS